MIALEAHLRSRRDGGDKLLVPYVTAGARSDWVDVVHAVVDAGADGVEIGIPFSDPVMDGPVIQDAAVRALAAGTTPRSVLDQLSGLAVDVPLAVMTYYNLVARFGLDHFASACNEAGVSGVILPDLPLDESDGWRGVADRHGTQPVMLVAPNTGDERLVRIADASRGFVYAIGTLGVTGERSELAPSAPVLAGRIKAVTDKPVLVGVGVSTPGQAGRACETADGVVIGSRVVRKMLEDCSAADVGAVVAEFRAAI